MLDIIIRNGKIIDGSGNPWYSADIAVDAGQIVEIGRVNSKAKETIDAAGNIVCPGFIDMHAHPDLTLFYKEVQDYKLRQGVTTEVGGNCGFTAAPLYPKTSEQLKKFMAFITPPTGVDWGWSTFKEYLQKVSDSSPATNLVPLVGHGTVRIAVMGVQQRAPTQNELSEMEMLVDEAMEAGAYGISTGLVYVPGNYAETEEIVALAKIAARHGGIYATHMRDEGENLINSVEETIAICQGADIAVQISHHKAAGKLNHGKVIESLGVIQNARNSGLDVTIDQYPYSASSTTLQAILPPWSQEGGVEKIVERLQDNEIRSEIQNQLLNSHGETRMGGVLDEILITEVKSHKNKVCVGKTLKQLSDLRNQESIDVALDLLIEEECAVGMVNFSMSEDDVKTVMQSPVTMIGSDGLYQVGNPHPRVYGTYPRVLGKYVREDEVLSLETAVRKMTGFPSQKLGLHKKGLLRVGFDADLVVLDPTIVKDQATFLDSRQYPVGIDYVIVNGQIAVADGQFTGTTAGVVVSKNR
ncbi:MAG: amidohydrolase [Dehalococcoidia bacterium]|nr:amidohydrolase [Dehalococcoidia bacterium]